MDVVSQPVAVLFVADEYRLLPVLQPFTAVTKREREREKEAREKATTVRLMTDEKGRTIHHNIRHVFPLFFPPPE